jgi:hypothetical protein
LVRDSAGDSADIGAAAEGAVAQAMERLRVVELVLVAATSTDQH